MRRYALAKAGQAFLALLALSLIVFLSAHATGDPAKYLLSPEAATRADYERLKEMLGLDRPLIVQFGSFIFNALRGDFGISIEHRRPVIDLLAERLPATLELAFSALSVALLVGIPLGVIAALRRRSLVDRIVTGLSILSMAAPQFWIGILLISLFAAHLNLLPAFGRGDLAHLILPTLTLGLYLVAGVVRLVRSSMLDVLTSDYVRFARLKGLTEARVTWKHALKNALIPVITFAGIMLGALLNGTIVVEQVFAWPGLGRLTLEAVTERNFPLLQGAVLLSGTFYIVSALVVDLAYAWVDPRIRYGKAD